VARIDDLNRLRDDLRLWLDEAPVDRRAALVAQYRATLTEIAELAPEQKTGDPVDEFTARRAARGGVTARARRSSGGPG